MHVSVVASWSGIIYRSGYGHGRTGFLFRTDSCESFPSASKDLPPQPVDFRLRIFWDHHPGGRAADRGAGIYLYSTGKCFYYIFWRHLFSISAAY